MIIMGDFNMTQSSKFLRTLQEKFYLADVKNEKMSPEQATRRTYKWGKNRLDHIFASWSILPAIHDVTYGVYEDLNSDHLLVKF